MTLPTALDAAPVPAGGRKAGLPPLILWGALLAIGSAWGLSQLFSKIAMSGAIEPLGAAAWQAMVGAGVALAALRLTGRRLPLTQRHLVFYAVCGLLGTAFPATLSYEAIRHLSVGIASIIIATVPMLTVLLALPMGLERAEAKRLAGVALGFTAILLLIGPEAALPGWGLAAWMILPLLAALAYAGENVIIASYQPADIGPLETGCGLLLAATLMLLPPALALGAVPIPGGAGWAAEGALLACTVLNIFAYLGYVWLIRQGGVVFTSQVGYIVTGTGVLAGMAFLDERHGWTVWLALAMLFAGIALVSPRPVDRG
ncbi:MAG: DMT family transporter [Pseudomonadota bacterium]